METRGGEFRSGVSTAGFGGTTADFDGPLVRVYHEVRSPTALIATVARSALEVQDAAKARSALELIERIADRALRRVATVLDSPPVPCALPSERLREIVTDLRKCGLLVELTVDPWADAAQVAQEASAFEALAQTLLDNAEAHGDPGSAIQVRLKVTRGGLRLSIANPPRRAPRHQGRGVGLPLARELTRRMGGTLRTRAGAGKFVVQAWMPASLSGGDLVSEGIRPTRD